MLWKGWLEGHQFDLEALSDLFSADDPLVAQDASGDYYVESAALQDSDGKIDANAAQALIRRINGAARAVNSGFRPVSLSGRYNDSSGAATVVGSAALVMGRMRLQATGVVTDSKGNIVSSSPAAPSGSRYLQLANQDRDVADALWVLGQSDPLDWYDIYKVWEIVEHAIGGSGQVQKLGWTTKADINRLTASANHPGISGDEARHARYKGSPGAI